MKKTGSREYRIGGRQRRLALCCCKEEQLPPPGRDCCWFNEASIRDTQVSPFTQGKSPYAKPLFSCQSLCSQSQAVASGSTEGKFPLRLRKLISQGGSWGHFSHFSQGEGEGKDTCPSSSLPKSCPNMAWPWLRTPVTLGQGLGPQTRSRHEAKPRT